MSPPSVVWRIDAIQGASYNWLTSIMTENTIARSTTCRVDALGRNDPDSEEGDEAGVTGVSRDERRQGHFEICGNRSPGRKPAQ